MSKNTRKPRAQAPAKTAAPAEGATADNVDQVAALSSAEAPVTDTATAVDPGADPVPESDGAGAPEGEAGSVADAEGEGEGAGDQDGDKDQEDSGDRQEGSQGKADQVSVYVRCHAVVVHDGYRVSLRAGPQRVSKGLVEVLEASGLLDLDDD